MTTRSGPSWATMDQEARTEYWATLALRHCRGLGPRGAVRLLKTFGTAHAALEARDRWHEAGVHKGIAAAMGTGSWRVTAREEWDAARQLDAAVLLWSDPRYPALLRQLPDAPALLYCRGDLSLLASPAFAIVGARRSTGHGRAVAGHMARCLSACGIAVVSGMALGIDRVAHEASVGRLGRSIGVLGAGIDVVYPPQNGAAYTAMERHGLLVSEFAPGAQPLPGNFPVRNRIISGLSLGVLVVEAALRSGSLITARLALEQNREVYAVPGPAQDEHCLGCQELVRQGARPVFSAEDVLHDLAERLRPFGISRASLPEEELTPLREEGGIAPEIPRGEGSLPGEKGRREPGKAAEGRSPQAAPPVPPVEAEELVSTGPRERLLVQLRRSGPMQADALARALEIPVAELNVMLVGLEMLGQVRRLPGARYEVAHET